MWQIKPKNIFTYGHEISLKSECNFRICKAKMYINETLVEFVNGNWWFIIKGFKLLNHTEITSRLVFTRKDARTEAVFTCEGIGHKKK